MCCEDDSEVQALSRAVAGLCAEVRDLLVERGGLVDRLDAAGRDAARLDWVEQATCELHVTRGERFTCRLYPGVWVSGRSAREVIDKAMESSR